MDFGKIYKITNTINNKVYIGKTIQRLNDRVYHHFNNWSNCLKLKNAIKIYGKENFIIELIEDNIPYEILDKREVYYINFYNSVKDGYNIKEGNKKAKHRKTHFILNNIKNIVIKEYNDGYKCYEIAKRNDICITSVYNILKNVKKYYNKNGFNCTGKIDFNKFVELKREGYATKELCKYFNVGRSSVKRMVQRHKDIIFPRVSKSCE